MMLERDIQESIRQAARQFGWGADSANHPKTLLETFSGSGSGGFFYHTWNSRKSEKGFPDIVMSDGKHLIIAEVKRNKPKGRLTPEQRNILDVFATHVPHTYLWREDDLSEVYDILARKQVFKTMTARSLWMNRRND
jgi:hypothetical protein